MAFTNVNPISGQIAINNLTVINIKFETITASGTCLTKLINKPVAIHKVIYID